MRADYHTHSNYSDGSFLWSMARAAEDAGLDAIGFADHCNVYPDEEMAVRKKAMGFNLDMTYERRREALDHIRDRFDVRLLDAIEMDYHPDHEAEIASFLDDADFDYAIGSVHELDDVNVHFESYFADKPDAERETLVDRYFEKLVALAESDLFDVAAHLDLVERNPVLRGYATEDQYHRVAEALEASRTVPELNAGRVLDEYGEIHPTPAFLEVLLEYDIEFVLGSDGHELDTLAPRKEELETFVAAHGVPRTTLTV